MICSRKPISSFGSSSSITSLVLSGDGGSSLVFTRLFVVSRSEPMEIERVLVLGPAGGDWSFGSCAPMVVIDFDRVLGRGGGSLGSFGSVLIGNFEAA